MEITLLPQNALRIKGKQTVLLINPTDASTPHQAALYFTSQVSGKASADSVTITGPGEYEIGGVKISGIKNKEGNVYSLNIEGIDMLVGDLGIVEKMQHKVKEHAIVLLQSASDSDASFVNGLATNVVLLYGEKAKDVIQKFAKEGVQEVNKYQITRDKLPQEIQTILLA